eukprot:533295_1
MAQEAPKQDGDLKALIGDKFLKQDGTVTTFKDSVAGNDLVGFYFSAHWCPPCRGFTPKLKACYEQWKKDGVKIELIFGSADKDENAFKSYFAEHGAYLAWDYSEKEQKVKELKTKYGVSGIPWLTIVDKNGKLIHNEADTLVGQKQAEAVKEWLKKI